MNDQEKSFGFGVIPKMCTHHFYVIIPKKETEFVDIYERYNWTEGDVQKIEPGDILRLRISRLKFSKINLDLASEFNSRLKKNKMKGSRFVVGETAVDRLFGKEMMVLLWGIEDTDPSLIPTAVRNWKGLMPEERWWLYTMTNASTGGIHDNNRGWRKALRFALCENPIREKPQTQLFESLTGDFE